MSFDIEAIANELASRIKNSAVGVMFGGSEGRVFDYMPDAPNPPQIGIAPPGGDFLLYDEVISSEAADLVLALTVALNLTSTRSAQQVAMSLLKPSGPTSLKAVIDGHRNVTVGVPLTTCDSARVDRATDYGTLQWPNGVTYFGFRQLILVKTS